MDTQDATAACSAFVVPCTSCISTLVSSLASQQAAIDPICVLGASTLLLPCWMTCTMHRAMQLTRLRSLWSCGPWISSSTSHLELCAVLHVRHEAVDTTASLYT